MNRLEEMKSYAQVLIEIGVELKKGQPLCVEAPVGTEEFVSILAQEAYRLGCGDFGVIWKSSALDRVKMEAGQFAPTAPGGSEEAICEAYAAAGAAFIRLDSPDPSAFAGIAPELLAQRAASTRQIRSVFRKKAKAGHTIACVPQPAWADMVFPDLPKEQRMDALWDAVLTCVRCRETDPIAAWRTYQQKTTERKQLLDEKHYTAFHYQSGQTDLHLKPAGGDIWMGGYTKTPDRISVPNIPTEEVFITPHKYSVNGHVAATMPLCYQGQLIEDIRLTFENGRIVSYDASSGRELLATIIEHDEGSHYLGEMALVDCASPIARLGRIFYTTLYDENASCHMAIGNSLGEPADSEQKEELGYNTSKIHVDFMIGSEDLNIYGQLTNGNWEPIFLNGHWAI